MASSSAIIPVRDLDVEWFGPMVAHVSDNGDIGPDAVGGDDDKDGPWPGDPLERHRRQFARFACLEGVAPYRTYLHPLYRVWDRCNRAFFEGRLTPPHITLEEPRFPGAFGVHTDHSGWGSGSQIRLRPSLLDGSHPAVRGGSEFELGRFLLVADCLMHETVHQYHAEITGRTEESYKGHGPAFRDECNRIGARLGLPPVRAAKARGQEKDLPSCAEWPLNVRPRGYYLGAFIYGERPARDGKERPEAEMPEALKRWLAADPELARRFQDLKADLFRELDQFFASHPAPPREMRQAVTYAMRAYIRRMERCGWKVPVAAQPPAVMRGA